MYKDADWNFTGVKVLARGAQMIHCRQLIKQLATRVLRMQHKLTLTRPAISTFSAFCLSGPLNKATTKDADQNGSNHKADSHITCRAHVVPLPCRAAKGLECVLFDLHSAAVSDSHLPCHAHAILGPCRSSQGHNTARPSLDGRAVLC